MTTRRPATCVAHMSGALAVQGTGHQQPNALLRPAAAPAVTPQTLAMQHEGLPTPSAAQLGAEWLTAARTAAAPLTTSLYRALDQAQEQERQAWEARAAAGLLAAPPTSGYASRLPAKDTILALTQQPGSAAEDLTARMARLASLANSKKAPATADGQDQGADQQQQEGDGGEAGGEEGKEGGEEGERKEGEEGVVGSGPSASGPSQRAGPPRPLSVTVPPQQRGASLLAPSPQPSPGTDWFSSSGVGGVVGGDLTVTKGAGGGGGNDVFKRAPAFGAPAARSGFLAGVCDGPRLRGGKGEEEGEGGDDGGVGVATARGGMGALRPMSFSQDALERFGLALGSAGHGLQVRCIRGAGRHGALHRSRPPSLLWPGLVPSCLPAA